MRLKYSPLDPETIPEEASAALGSIVREFFNDHVRRSGYPTIIRKLGIEGMKKADAWAKSLIVRMNERADLTLGRLYYFTGSIALDSDEFHVNVFHRDHHQRVSHDVDSIPVEALEAEFARSEREHAYHLDRAIGIQKRIRSLDKG